MDENPLTPADRRHYPRADARFRVEYVVELQEDAALATSLDVSLGGIAFPCDHELSVGTILNMKISGGGLAWTFTAEGEVRRCWRVNDQICVGVQFSKVEATGQQAILKLTKAAGNESEG